MKLLSVHAVSREAVEAVYRYSHTYHIPLILSFDALTCNVNSGYLCSTEELMSLMRQNQSKYPDAKVFSYRKNLGPGFGNSDLTATWKTLRNDLRFGIDCVHLNFTNLRLSRQENVSKISEAVRFINKQSFSTQIELGDRLLGHKAAIGDIEEFLRNDISPLYLNFNTGSDVRENYQYGTFHENHVEEVISRCPQVRLKESNSDFLTREQILSRYKFLNSLEIGAELSYAQNTKIVQFWNGTGTSYDRVIHDAMENKAWKKLLHVSSPDDINTCLSLSLHWYLNSSANKLYSKIPKEVTESIISSLIQIIDRYASIFKGN